jgi:RNA polymerase sigma factor (sigma-70 family)
MLLFARHRPYTIEGMTDDSQLLREYAERGSENAFRELVERHARMVYGVAWRVLHDHGAAEEATQATFILLARKARRLRPGTLLAGWLFRTARFVALEARRADYRRLQHHEAIRGMNESSKQGWEKISLYVDEALASLGSKDRDAIVLRFFEDKTFAEVASALCVTEAAAKMRIARALEKLRGRFAHEGIAISAIVLGAELTAHGSPEVSTAFAQSVSATVLAVNSPASATLATLVKGALKIMAWNNLRNGIAIALIILLLGGGASLIALKQYHSAKRAPVVSTFEPMVGEWEGTFEMRGDGFAEPLRQDTALSIQATPDGRSCRIEMRVLAPNGGGVARIFRFTHSLNDAGNRIITLDDPNIARPLGEGIVTAGAHDAAKGEWRAGFHAASPGGGSTDCEWQRRANELVIVRHDRTVTRQGENEVVSELRLRRTGTVRL